MNRIKIKHKEKFDAEKRRLYQEIKGFLESSKLNTLKLIDFEAWEKEVDRRQRLQIMQQGVILQ